jgi:hypothetical protein
MKKLTVERAKELEAIWDKLETAQYIEAIDAANAKLEEIYTKFVKDNLVEGEEDFKKYLQEAWKSTEEYAYEEPLNYPTRADALSHHTWQVICMAQEDE